MNKLNEAKLAQERLLLSSQLEAKQEKDCLEKINKKYQKSKAANIVLKEEIKQLQIKVQETAINAVQVNKENKHLKEIIKMKQ